MKNKERFEIKDRWLVDTENNYKQIYAIDSYIDRPVIDLLNQQDKHIKELEQENLALKEQNKSQPSEIVEKIRKQIFNHFNVNNMEEYESLSMLDSLFTADAVIDMLDDILKEY